MLYVDSTHSLLSLRNRRFLESLTASQFLDYTCFLELSLEFLKRLLDVFALLYCLIIYILKLSGKITDCFGISKTFSDYFYKRCLSP